MFGLRASRPASGPPERERQRERRRGRRVGGASGPAGRLEDVQKVLTGTRHPNLGNSAGRVRLRLIVDTIWLHLMFDTPPGHAPVVTLIAGRRWTGNARGLSVMKQRYHAVMGSYLERREGRLTGAL